jgi:hypothetical protein
MRAMTWRALSISPSAAVSGSTELGDTLYVHGNSTFDKDVTFEQAITVKGTFTALGNYFIGDNALTDSLTVR